MTQAVDLVGFEPSNTGPKDGRCLVVILNGWLGTPAKMNDVKTAVRDTYGSEPDFYVPPLDYANLFSTTPAAEIVSQLLENMDTICDPPAKYGKIVLVGISMGGVFARRLFLAATDIHKAVPNEKELGNAHRRHWVDKVERIVTLGGLNRGWLSSGRLSWVESFFTNLVGLMGHLRPGTSRLTIFEVRRGAPFIVQTRLQWLKLRRSREPDKPEPLVIQLLGTQDNLVAPDDAVDFAVDRGRESPYFYLELPHTRHDNAFVFSPSMCDRDGKFGRDRKAKFINALTWSRDQLVKYQIASEYLADTLPEEPDPKVKHVVFIVHGIRDDGYWTRKIAQRIREHAADAAKRFGKNEAEEEWRCVTSSYGYFAMLPFLLPWVRTQKVEWLMDLYVGVKSRFPCAKFSYVGHSNGTYLIARALQDYPAARFHHVLFAGSVVRRNYEWDKLLAIKRVDKVVNMVATRDWVVALFPQGLEPLRRFFDLGGAGFGGFDQARRAPKDLNLNEVRYVIGSHSAGLVETQWPRIADFIVNGTDPAPPDPDYSDKQSRFMRCVSKVSTAIFAVLVVLAVAILVWILHPIFASNTTAMEAAGRVLLAVLYVMTLRFIVTRV